MERYRTTIILVVVLVVLAGVAFFLNSNRTSGGTDTTATPTPDVSKLALGSLVIFSALSLCHTSALSPWRARNSCLP